MPISIPFIPESITVHLGAPNAQAANVTVSFADYVKNVVSSEIYPTWEQAAISANIFAIVSYALNRVYTEYYRSRGYDFDITNSTAVDQKFIEGRNFFENVSVMVDSMFDDYIRRQGFLEPLAAKFCNGTTSTCNGLSQWGSQELAMSGQNALEILRNYYGNNIEIVNNAAVRGIRESYPGTPVRIGDSGPYVQFIQAELNRISQNYPAINKVAVDGVFNEATQKAVMQFQPIFSLPEDGVVDRATWYRMVQIYVAVLGLSELESEGRGYSGISWEYPDAIELGNRGIKVAHLQYMLAVLGMFIRQVPPLTVNGIFDEATLSAVRGFQRYAGLNISGTVDAGTWDVIYSQFAGVEGTVFNDAELYPFTADSTQAQGLRQLETQLRSSQQTMQTLPALRTDAEASRGNRQVQRQQNTQGRERPKSRSGSVRDSARYMYSSRFEQYPWQDFHLGMRDREV